MDGEVIGRQKSDGPIRPFNRHRRLTVEIVLEANFHDFLLAFNSVHVNVDQKHSAMIFLDEGKSRADDRILRHACTTGNSTDQGSFSDPQFPDQS